MGLLIFSFRKRALLKQNMASHDNLMTQFLALQEELEEKKTLLKKTKAEYQQPRKALSTATPSASAGASASNDLNDLILTSMSRIEARNGQSPGKILDEIKTLRKDATYTVGDILNALEDHQKVGLVEYTLEHGKGCRQSFRRKKEAQTMPEDV